MWIRFTITIAIGALLGLGIGVGTGKLVDWRSRPRRVRSTAPSGTRPNVRIIHDDVIYDVTEELEYLGPDATGCAVWLIHGPVHLRMLSRPEVEVLDPVPESTHLAVRFENVDGGRMRFSTREESDPRHADIIAAMSESQS